MHQIKYIQASTKYRIITIIDECPNRFDIILELILLSIFAKFHSETDNLAIFIHQFLIYFAVRRWPEGDGIICRWHWVHINKMIIIQFIQQLIHLMQEGEKHLLQLVFAKENSELTQLKKTLSPYCKYFFNIRRNITIVYDSSTLYAVHKEYLKVIDLGKPYIITDLAYNYQKHIALFLTPEGHLYAHFAQSKTQVLIKKDFKKVFVMEWVYSASQTASFFVAEEAGVRLYKLDEEKKSIKEVKHISGKYHCFLYEPLGQFLVGFQYGGCDLAYIIHFDPQRAKNWFRCGEVEVNFAEDEAMGRRIKAKKCLGLEGSRINKEVLLQRKDMPEDYFIDIQRIQGTPYMFFYYSNQGKLQLTPLVQSDRKQVTIKLPSDSVPSLNVLDNMLVVHLRNERISFIYDVNHNNFQALVSPYPLAHQRQELNSRLYSCEFISRRAILPDGQISKWKISLPVIYHYLKTEMQIFEFLHRRSNSKMEVLRWMRENLFSFKHINLSKMWKLLFAKIGSYLYDESETISLIQIYSNLFYPLSIDPLVNRNALADILVQSIRQANQYHLIIPDQFQVLATQMLLSTQKYDLLTYLCHHGVVNCDQKIFRLIFEKGFKEDNDLLVTLSIDLTFQTCPAKEVLRMIMKTQRVREGKRFIRTYFDKMEALDIMEAAKYITSPDLKKQFMGYARLFILKKYPMVNPIYLDEAESKLVS